MTNSIYFQNADDLKEWLFDRELHYGGVQSGVPRRSVSPLDPRSEDQIRQGGMTGGDRMSVHGYAADYAKFLLPLVQRRNRRVVVAEVGILRGTGLAVWSDLFPQGRIIGLDIDPSHVKEHMPILKALGAFSSVMPELYDFDQFVDQKKRLHNYLGRDKIDVYIDDGYHSFESINTSLKSVMPYLSRHSVCFIEDNKDVWWRLQELYPRFKIQRYGEMTVLTQNKPAKHLKRYLTSLLRRAISHPLI